MRNISSLTWNVQSIRNKCEQVLEHVIDNDADVVFLTETWMEADKNDITSMVKDRGYKMHHDRRKDREKEIGGGVGILVKMTMVSKHITSKAFSSFEHTMVEVKLTNNTKLILISLYRLQFVKANTFLDEFSEFLEMLSVMKDNFVLSGDINFHLETDTGIISSLNDIFTMFNLVQHVNFPTHRYGHALDFVLTRKEAPNICKLEPNDVNLSDHFMVTFGIEVEVVKHEYKTLSFRNYKATTEEQFMTTVKEKYRSVLENDTAGASTMSGRVKCYNAAIKESVDTSYPLVTKRIKLVPNAPWFDSEYKELRKLRRRAEKKYKKTKLPEDKERFVILRKQTTSLAFNKKREHCSRKIKECNGQTKALFSCVNRLLDIKQDSVLPSHDSEVELAERFVEYFKEKIHSIRKSFPKYKPELETKDKGFKGVVLEVFEPTSEEEIQSIITSHGIKCAPDDPIPAILLKKCYSVFIPIWVDLVNLSLGQGSMDCLKSAVLAPLFKEMDKLMDCDLEKNYRPVSNLQFLGKLIERVVKLR